MSDKLVNGFGQTIELIGIAGRARSGKDTLAHRLHIEHGFSPRSFAWPIKHGLNEMLGLDPRVWTDGAKEDSLDWIEASPRKLAQTLGTEWGRSIDADLWVKVLEHELLNSGETKCVIADVRFQNEAAWVRKHGTLLHVVRPGGLSGAEASHASEAGVRVEPGETVLANSGSLDDYHTLITRLFKQHYHVETDTFDFSRIQDDRPAPVVSEDWAFYLIHAQKQLERFHNNLINGRAEDAVQNYHAARDAVEAMYRIGGSEGFKSGTRCVVL